MTSSPTPATSKLPPWLIAPALFLPAPGGGPEPELDGLARMVGNGVWGPRRDRSSKMRILQFVVEDTRATLTYVDRHAAACLQINLIRMVVSLHGSWAMVASGKPAATLIKQ